MVQKINNEFLWFENLRLENNVVVLGGNTKFCVHLVFSSVSVCSCATDVTFDFRSSSASFTSAQGLTSGSPGFYKLALATFSSPFCAVLPCRSSKSRPTYTKSRPDLTLHPKNNRIKTPSKPGCGSQLPTIGSFKNTKHEDWIG